MEFFTEFVTNTKPAHVFVLVFILGFTIIAFIARIWWVIEYLRIWHSRFDKSDDFFIFSRDGIDKNLGLPKSKMHELIFGEDYCPYLDEEHSCPVTGGDTHAA